MCGRFTIVSPDDVPAVARAIEYDDRSGLERLEALDSSHQGTDAFPGSTVPVLLTSTEKLRPLRIKFLEWGYPLEGKKNGVFNTRLETAAQSRMWRKSFETRHCVIPAWTFCETNANEMVPSPKTGKPIKQAYRFYPKDDGMLLIAGIWEPGHFSMLTTEAAGAVAGIHDRMPVMVDLDGARSWLFDGVLRQDDQATLLIPTKL